MERFRHSLVLLALFAAGAAGALYAERMGGMSAASGANVPIAKDKKPEGPPPAALAQAPPVGVAEVIVRDVQLWDEFSGRLTAVEQVEVRPRVEGAIAAVHLKDGAVVARGDLLFTLDPAPYRAEVNRAAGALASAEAQETLAKAEFERGERLARDGAIPQRDFDQRRNSLTVAAANVKSAAAALERAQLNLGYTRITAPIAGRVGRAEVTAGNLVGAGVAAPVLTTIVSSSPIYADFDIDESTFLRAAARRGEPGGLAVTLRLKDDAREYTGKLQSFDNRFDSASGTLRARAVFDNPDGTLVPGFFARLRLGGAEKSRVLLVSDRAIGTDQNKKFVLVVDGDNAVTWRAVTLGPAAEGLRVVENGLQPGERVVVSGVQRVRPGMTVAPQAVPMDATEDGAVPGAPAP